MAFTDQQILNSHAKNSPQHTDPTSLFYAVCLDVLGYTPLGQCVLDMTEYNVFEARYNQLIPPPKDEIMLNYKLTQGTEVLFLSEEPEDLARHVVEAFPPEGAFPSPNSLNAGFAIVLPDGSRLQGQQAVRWITQHR